MLIVKVTMTVMVRWWDSYGDDDGDEYCGSDGDGDDDGDDDSDSDSDSDSGGGVGDSGGGTVFVISEICKIHSPPITWKVPPSLPPRLRSRDKMCQSQFFTQRGE